ncbi:related to suppressor protein PSP1 [Ustilago trichophora]|uniref:Related to suppressor protein PSP1 n=1 Tax=Ustilago trichophora TaxID=86804 RepID=A0A5C3EP39_9BASI|nr:related to suppressor protein PSP1 [Ustilago trichophora]
MADVSEAACPRAVQIGTSASSSSSGPSSLAQDESRRRTASSSPGSSPTPSNPSHPASLNGDDARHGTSPATSVDGPSVPPTGLKLDISSTTAQSRHEQQASLSRAGVARSPHPLDASQEARGSLAARTGGILATMQEEGPAFSDSRRESTLGFDATQSYSQMEQAMRASRNRSASSAAALALHGNNASFVDRWASNASGRIAPARSIWEGSNADTMSSGGSTGGSGAPQRPLSQLQRGFSASFVRNKPEPPSPSPFLSSPAGFHDLGFDFTETSSLRTSRASMHAASSPFGAVPDLPELSSYPGSAEVEELQRPTGGTESRRHSVAGTGPHREAAGVIGGHRRAIGFDVASTYGQGNGGRDRLGQGMASDGGWPRHGRDRSVSSVTPGFNPFAGGSLALSMDDLASDLDFEPPSQRANTTTSRPSVDPLRVPTSNAADSGTHATSMPSALDDRGFGGFRAGSIGFADTQRTNRSGVDSLSASWDYLMPSQMAARSPGEGQRTLAEMTRQLRQMSIGEGDVRARPHPSGVASIFDSQAEGTRTVRASPGTSPTSHRAPSTTQGLSAQAKSFTASQPLAPLAQDALGGLNGYGFLPPGMAQSGRLGAQMPVLPPYGLPQPLGFGGPVAGVAGSGVMPALSSNDPTFSSLAALGPMPPASMGPPGGLGGLGGPLTSAGTTGELQDLGKGVPLATLSRDTPLYIVEFKQGRTDLFFQSRSASQSPSKRDGEPIRRGDLVIVEADRGKDLGTVVNDSITVEQVQAFLAHQSDLTIGTAAVGAAGVHGQGGLMGACSSGDDACSIASGLSGSPCSSTMSATQGSTGSGGVGTRPMRTINPKRLFTKATAADTSTLYSKAQDEERALQLCASKVMQRGLPMSVVAAEMQWDRRKLTFYYTASMRVDFRDLVKELFRLYKTRIWMCHLGHPSGAGMG